MEKFVIVGGTSGIGLKLTTQLSEEGHEVHVLSREARDVENIQGVKHYAVDVTDDDPDFPEIEGSISGYVYCAGSINLKPFKMLKTKHFVEDFNINVMGAIKSFKAYEKQLVATKKGSVVFFSTVAVQTGMSYHTSIGMAKGAIEGLTRSLAAELAPDVRVNCIAPSVVDTPLAKKIIGDEAKKKASGDKHPMKRVGEVGDLASMARFLLGSDAGWITGQVIHVDGGMSSIRPL